MVLTVHVTNSILYVSTYIRPIATKHEKVVTYCEELPSTNSQNPVSSRDKLSTLYLHLQKTPGHQTRQGADLP